MLLIHRKNEKQKQLIPIESLYENIYQEFETE